MILGSKELLKRVRKEGLVKNLSKRELNNPEGPGFDLRAGEFYKIRGEGMLGVSERQTVRAKLIASVKNKDKEIILTPGSYHLVSTLEEIKMGKDIFASIYPRSTLFRSGINLLYGKVSPGYYGKLTFGITNLSSANFRIELGARIAFIVFSEVLGESGLSRGQWQGGRVVAEKKEKQV